MSFAQYIDGMAGIPAEVLQLGVVGLYAPRRHPKLDIQQPALPTFRGLSRQWFRWQCCARAALVLRSCCHIAACACAIWLAYGCGNPNWALRNSAMRACVVAR